MCRPDVQPASTRGQEARFAGSGREARGWRDGGEAWRARVEGQRGFYPVSYTRLDVYKRQIEGNGTLFVRRDETEAAWQWVDAIASGWREAGMVPKPYPAGTWGPSATVSLVDRLGHGWRE